MIRKVLFVSLVLLFVVGVGFAMRSNYNIITYDTHQSEGDSEYSVRYHTMIKVVGLLSKRTFENIFHKVFDKRWPAIKEGYVLELAADDPCPEYRLRNVQARSIDDINNALDEVDNYKR